MTFFPIVPIYKGKKINKTLCILFLILFVCSAAAAVLLESFGIILAQITGAFALLYGIFWAVWAVREKRAEEALREAEEIRKADRDNDYFSWQEFVLPKEQLTEEAFRRFNSIVKGCVFIALGFFTLITVILIWKDALVDPAQLFYILFFCLAITIPGIIMQLAIYKKYASAVPRRIGLYPGKLVIDDTVITSMNIRDIRISPTQVYNPNSPSVFREMEIQTSEGKMRCRIDFRAYAHKGGELCWKEYPRFAKAMSDWGDENRVPVTIAYMD